MTHGNIHINCPLFTYATLAYLSLYCVCADTYRDRILTDANYVKMTKEEIDEALKGKSHQGMDIKICLEAFDARLYWRGLDYEVNIRYVGLTV